MKKVINFLFIFAAICQNLTANPQVEEDAFTEGYFISKLEDKFPHEKIELDVHDNNIVIYQFNSEQRQNIQRYLESFPDYTVTFDSTYVPTERICHSPEIQLESIGEEGGWIPEVSTFFPTMLANPHIVGYSAGYRTYDKIFKIGVLPVSIGDQFSIYQFKIDSRSRLYMGIEACVWAIFEARAKSLSLINADYFIALPLTYINDKFSMRLRVWHESSHLGDEFLLEHMNIKRLNPSMEVADISLSYDIVDRLTVFGGYSRVLRSDESYKIKPNGVFYGFNYFLDVWKIKVCNLEATPYIATYFTNLEDNNWALDSSVAVGYQWDKLYGHKLRIYIEGHKGYSAEGQFSKNKTSYAAIKLFYGY